MTGVKLHNQPGFEKDQEDGQKQLEHHVNKKVVCVVVHKPTNKATAQHVKIREVRLFAEKAIEKFQEMTPVGEEPPKNGEFVVIEVGIDDPTHVKVTSLENV